MTTRDEAIEAATAVLTALDAAHAAGLIVYRDELEAVDVWMDGSTAYFLDPPEGAKRAFVLRGYTEGNQT